MFLDFNAKINDCLQAIVVTGSVQRSGRRNFTTRGYGLMLLDLIEEVEGVRDKESV